MSKYPLIERLGLRPGDVFKLNADDKNRVGFSHYRSDNFHVDADDLERLLESLPEVRIREMDYLGRTIWVASQIPVDEHTHTARIIMVEPIVRKPKKVVLESTYEHIGSTQIAGVVRMLGETILKSSRVKITIEEIT
jgi:hypothetical protein